MNIIYMCMPIQQQLLNEYYLHVYANPFISNNNWYNSSFMCASFYLLMNHQRQINSCHTKFYTPFLL